MKDAMVVLVLMILSFVTSSSEGLAPRYWKVHSDDSIGDNTVACSLSWEGISLKGKHYELPHGGIDTQFVNMLLEEIECSNNGGQHSEWEFVFTALVLKCDKIVQKASDIAPLLARWMDMWEAGRRCELLQEARCCDK